MSSSASGFTGTEGDGFGLGEAGAGDDGAGFGETAGAGFGDTDATGFGNTDTGFGGAAGGTFGSAVGEGAASTLESGRPSARPKINNGSFMNGKQPTACGGKLADALRVAKIFRMSDHLHARMTIST